MNRRYLIRRISEESGTPVEQVAQWAVGLSVSELVGKLSQLMESHKE